MAKMKLNGKQAAVLGAAAVATGAVIVANKRKHKTPVDNAIPEEMPSSSDLDTQKRREEPPKPSFETSA